MSGLEKYEKESPVFINDIDDNILKRALLLCEDVIITQTGTKNKRDYGFTLIIEKENFLLNNSCNQIFKKLFTKIFPIFFLD